MTMMLFKSLVIAAMDPEQQDAQFFQMLESAYDSIIENHIHPEEESMGPPLPDFDCAGSDTQVLPIDCSDCLPSSE